MTHPRFTHVNYVFHTAQDHCTHESRRIERIGLGGSCQLNREGGLVGANRSVRCAFGKLSLLLQACVRLQNMLGVLVSSHVVGPSFFDVLDQLLLLQRAGSSSTRMEAVARRFLLPDQLETFLARSEEAHGDYDEVVYRYVVDRVLAHGHGNWLQTAASILTKSSFERLARVFHETGCHNSPEEVLELAISTCRYASPGEEYPEFAIGLMKDRPTRRNGVDVWPSSTGADGDERAIVDAATACFAGIGNDLLYHGSPWGGSSTVANNAADLFDGPVSTTANKRSNRDFGPGVYCCSTIGEVVRMIRVKYSSETCFCIFAFRRPAWKATEHKEITGNLWSNIVRLGHGFGRDTSAHETLANILHPTVKALSGPVCRNVAQVRQGGTPHPRTDLRQVVVKAQPPNLKMVRVFVLRNPSYDPSMKVSIAATMDLGAMIDALAATSTPEHSVVTSRGDPVGLVTPEGALSKAFASPSPKK